MVSLKIGKDTKYCYPRHPGKEGWCIGVGKSEKEKSFWGWCEDFCKYNKDPSLRARKILASRLQETKLNVLPMSHCRKLVDMGNYNYWGRWDLCAGKKRKFKNIVQYKKEKDKYIFYKNVTNYFGMNDKGNYPFDYYVSGSDSCNGDSGGGAYFWKKKGSDQPTLIGIVSRGFGSDSKDGCGEFNFPGIYTRVTQYLNWIYKHAEDGKC